MPVDIAGYERRPRKGRCFVCATAGGDSEDGNAHLMIYADRDVLLFLNRYPTLVGHALVCPRRHVERVIGDFSEQEYLKLLGWIYRVGRAIEQVVPTERLYILSLRSQQGNRHVLWHLAPLPAGIAYVDQQFAALRMSRGGAGYSAGGDGAAGATDSRSSTRSDRSSISTSRFSTELQPLA